MCENKFLSTNALTIEFAFAFSKDFKIHGQKAHPHGRHIEAKDRVEGEGGGREEREEGEREERGEGRERYSQQRMHSRREERE